MMVEGRTHVVDIRVGLGGGVRVFPLLPPGDDDDMVLRTRTIGQTTLLFTFFFYFTTLITKRRLRDTHGGLWSDYPDVGPGVYDATDVEAEATR